MTKFGAFIYVSILNLPSAVLLEEWIASILHARKGLELLENRNGIYVMYIDRLIGDVAKRVGQSSFSQKLNEDIRSSLFS